MHLKKHSLIYSFQHARTQKASTQTMTASKAVPQGGGLMDHLDPLSYRQHQWSSLLKQPWLISRLTELFSPSTSTWDLLKKQTRFGVCTKLMASSYLEHLKMLLEFWWVVLFLSFKENQCLSKSIFQFQYCLQIHTSISTMKMWSKLILFMLFKL